MTNDLLPGGLAVTVTGTDGSSMSRSYTYDNLGRRATETLARRTSATNPALVNLTTSYQYDALDRITRVTDPLGNIAETVYDANGKTKQINAYYKKPDGTFDTRTLVTRIYNQADRMASETDIYGNTSTYRYDNAGNVIQSIDTNGHISRYEYDAMNRRTAVIDPNGYRTVTTYDLAGHPVAVTNPNAEVVPLPSTYAYQPQDKLRHLDYNPVPPVEQILPVQEAGIRPARALPYALHAHGRLNVSNGIFSIDFANTGQATAVFQVRSGNAGDIPRSYTVEPGKHLTDTWNVIVNGATAYDLSVYGPNGFMRVFKGDYSSANLDIRVIYEKENAGLNLVVLNKDLRPREVQVFDNYTNESFSYLLTPKDSMKKDWPSNKNFGWYDMTIKVHGDIDFEYRLTGHVETGKDSVTDPAIGYRVLKR